MSPQRDSPSQVALNQQNGGAKRVHVLVWRANFLPACYTDNWRSIARPQNHLILSKAAGNTSQLLQITGIGEPIFELFHSRLRRRWINIQLRQRPRRYLLASEQAAH